jgi:hypothetical protein
MIPPDFYKVLKDFLEDIKNTYPELTFNSDLTQIIQSTNMEETQSSFQKVFDHMTTVFPPLFFDILYEKETLFASPVYFLPDINFKLLWNENITDRTKTVIWKYLKLVLLLIVGNANGDQMGDVSKLFDTLDDPEIKDKLKDAIKDIHTFFETDEKKGPSVDNIHSRLESMMNGKLGGLAKEIAEETIGNINLENATSSTEMFQTMMKDPSKLMGLVNTVGSKIDAKLKSGDLKESELMTEASDMLKHMKDMPGMKQFESMFQQFGKVDLSAMQSKIDEQIKRAKTKERLQEKLKKRQSETPTPPEENKPTSEPVKLKKKKKKKTKAE